MVTRAASCHNACYFFMNLSIYSYALAKDENDESSKLKEKTTMSSAKRNRHISMDVHMSAGELFPGMRSNTSKSIRKTLLAEPIPIDKLLRWELRRLTKVSYNAKAKQQIYDMVG